MAVIYVRFRDDSGARAMPATKRCTRADPRHKEQPGWVDRLPRLDWRISIDVEPADGGQ